MVTILRSLAAAAILASPSWAQEGPSAAEFEAYVTGKTLYYAQDGQAYGVEEYLPGRRVRWSFLDGDCLEGHWYPEGDLICFAYEGHEKPQCWEFHTTGKGLSARFSSDPEGERLYEIYQTQDPMICLGPRIGV